MSQDKVTTAASPDPEATPDVSRTLGLSKEELRKQISELDLSIHVGRATVHCMPERCVDQIMSLLDKYCETREVEAAKEAFKNSTYQNVDGDSKYWSAEGSYNKTATHKFFPQEWFDERFLPALKKSLHGDTSYEQSAE